MNTTDHLTPQEAARFAGVTTSYLKWLRTSTAQRSGRRSGPSYRKAPNGRILYDRASVLLWATERKGFKKG